MTARDAAVMFALANWYGAERGSTNGITPIERVRLHLAFAREKLLELEMPFEL